MYKFEDIKKENMEVRNLEKHLKENGVMEKEKIITWAMEVILFYDTLGEIESVIESNLPRNKIILINSISLYTAIDEYEQRVAAEKVKVNTKYKILTLEA